MTPTAPTVEELETYIKLLPPDTIVGKCVRADGCLIAAYMYKRYPALDFSVQLGSEVIEYAPKGTNYTRFMEDRKFIPLPSTSPLWKVARGFDTIGDHGEEITARLVSCYLTGFTRATRQGWA